MMNFFFKKKRVVEKTNETNTVSDKANKPIVNEAVLLEKKVIFIAIPKTGSSSIRSQLKQEGTPLIRTSHLDILQIRDLLTMYFLKLALSKNETFPSENVLSYSSIKEMANKTFDSCFKFSAVRNPWARAVSMYSRKSKLGMKDKISFVEFCDKHLYASDTCIHPTLHKNQYDWLCDEQGKNLMDYVYKLEHFEQGIIDINERTNGRLGLMNIVKNKNLDSPSQNYRSMYNSTTQKMIAKRFEKDIDMFKFTF